MSSRQRVFAFGRMTMTTKGTFESPLDKHASSICADFRGKWFEVITYAGKVGLNGFQIDMAALKSDIVTKGFGCGVNRHVV
jgi:hypothetical protein